MILYAGIDEMITLPDLSGGWWSAVPALALAILFTTGVMAVVRYRAELRLTWSESAAWSAVGVLRASAWWFGLLILGPAMSASDRSLAAVLLWAIGLGLVIWLAGNLVAQLPPAKRAKARLGAAEADTDRLARRASLRPAQWATEEYRQ